MSKTYEKGITIMGLNFRKSINLGKGFKLNVGKKSVGISGGVKGARVSVSSSGRKTATFSIPGTGLSYSLNLNNLFGKKKTSKKKGSSDNEAETDDNAPTELNINLVLVLIIVLLIAVIVGLGVFALSKGLITL